MTRRPLILVALAALAGGRLDAQRRVDVRSAVLYEAYTFDTLLVFDRVTELTVPVVVTARFGQALQVTLSGGYVRTDLRSADTAQLGDQSLAGPIDTEFRIGYDLVPGKLVLIGTGAIPSGRKTVAQEQLAILGALSSDIIGFSAANLGTGGNVGGGLAGALPVGRFALGLGATFRQSLQYQPILGVADTLLRPGAELRVRAGLEGPLSRRTYLRFAGIYAARQKDQINGDNRHGVGNRFIGYLALSQGLGPASVQVYAFDVFRGDPQIEPTVLGAARLPRGNLFSVGASAAFRMGDRTSLAPQFEYRSSAQAAAAADSAGAVDNTLRKAGESIRVGLEVRRDLSDAASLVFRGSGASGSVIQSGQAVGLGGFRLGAVVELRP